MSVVSQIIVWAFAVAMICLAIISVFTLFALAYYAFKELRGDKHD